MGNRRTFRKLKIFFQCYSDFRIFRQDCLLGFSSPARLLCIEKNVFKSAPLSKNSALVTKTPFFLITNLTIPSKLK